MHNSDPSTQRGARGGAGLMINPTPFPLYVVERPGGWSGVDHHHGAWRGRECARVVVIIPVISP